MILDLNCVPDLWVLRLDSIVCCLLQGWYFFDGLRHELALAPASFTYLGIVL